MTIKDFLMIVGTLSTFAIIVLFGMGIFCALRELIDKLKCNYRVKHRFDKPPTAKCYCIDCKYHSEVVGRCCRFNMNTADNWFCWDAEPIKKNA